MKNGNPCRRDCPRRSETCHGGCAEYAAFWERCEKERQARARINENGDMREGMRKSLVKKMSRIRQGRG